MLVSGEFASMTSEFGTKATAAGWCIGIHVLRTLSIIVQDIVNDGDPGCTPIQIIEKFVARVMSDSWIIHIGGFQSHSLCFGLKTAF